ncbi:MAG TPA: ABC transporter substrate-binding protein, partial [Planctomycetota bacterium]|nr:ABC transporter substrate-binding protein [Planctomycetota bacterium]
IPLTAVEVPKPEYFDKAGNPLPAEAPAEVVARAVYTLRLRPGIKYQDHPCFAPLDPEFDFSGIRSIEDFPNKATRDLKAHDYVWQIKRLANPINDCPILSVLENKIDGLDELAQRLAAELEHVRAERKKAAGALYNQEKDERENPIFLDLDRFDFPGARVVDDLTFQIVLKVKYPQMKYWLAMPFFSPLPKEADRFYAQGALVARSITLNTSAVGTGAYRFDRFKPNREIVLTRNENYRGTPYPSEGMPEDREAGLLADAGKTMPFVDKAIYKLEKEAIPRWTKFLQGYYDTSLIASDVFSQAVSLSSVGALDLSDEMRTKGIELMKDPEPTLYYYAFNMHDDVVGGYTPERKKLRQAISIAVDVEEYIQIFRNGRDMSPNGPIPPGIFGNRTGREGLNPVVYEWDEATDQPRRKSIDDAKTLLAEAGYPLGRGPDGKPLVLYFDNSLTGSEAKAELDWFRKQFAKLGIDLQSRTTDYNRFQDKASEGNFQILQWGWIADYPDPENFTFLLYGPNSKKNAGGENAANYDNPEFNRLFKRMEAMDDTPERQAVIDKLVATYREDCPWIPLFFLVEYQLNNPWYRNSKAMAIGGGTLKYRRVDPALREKLRAEWNEPVWWPLALLGILVVGGAVPAVLHVRRLQRRGEYT